MTRRAKLTNPVLGLILGSIACLIFVLIIVAFMYMLGCKRYCRKRIVSRSARSTVMSDELSPTMARWKVLRNRVRVAAQLCLVFAFSFFWRCSMSIWQSTWCLMPNKCKRTYLLVTSIDPDQIDSLKTSVVSRTSILQRTMPPTLCSLTMSCPTDEDSAPDSWSQFGLMLNLVLACLLGIAVLSCIVVIIYFLNRKMKLQRQYRTSPSAAIQVYGRSIPMYPFAPPYSSTASSPRVMEELPPAYEATSIIDDPTKRVWISRSDAMY